ncbi:F390 synthetase-related protein [Paenibacillus periandrae]|uniref:F390 synthetase-related protein n=1 Tax=Paenibacillus periandrae TaxID=1761741 RepID=UPI001F08A610|nr:F390 synthetase-related protein [Paenibacillus periandrae]
MLNRKATVLWHYFLDRYLLRWANRHAFEEWQEARINTHLQLILESSAFYQELWNGLTLSKWREFPIIDKQIMMDHFDSLNTVGIRKEEAFALALKAESTRNFTPQLNGITIGLSSGTSGNRGLFVVSPQEQYAWAGRVLSKVLPGSLLASHRIAFFLRANSNLYGSVSGARLRFEFFDLIEPMQQHIHRLNSYLPNLWIAPPSVLRLLADACLQGRLAVKPQRMISVAEVLDPLDRQYIESVFQLPVHQVYQCTEGFLAATCAHGTLHLNEDIVAFQKESMDGERRFVPILTDFTRFSQPLVRYRLNDLLVERSRPCPCGSLMTGIEAVEGRCDDLFYLPHAVEQELVPVFPDLITRAIMGVAPTADAYRIVQSAPDRIELSLQFTADTPSTIDAIHAAVLLALETLFIRMHCRKPSIFMTPYEAIVPGAKKLRRVERRFSIGSSHSNL